MLSARKFRIVVTDPSNPNAFDPDFKGKEISYSGEKVSVIIGTVPRAEPGLR
jgi:hypothetical protein